MAKLKQAGKDRISTITKATNAINKQNNKKQNKKGGHIRQDLVYTFSENGSEVSSSYDDRRLAIELN